MIYINGIYRPSLSRCISCLVIFNDLVVMTNVLSELEPSTSLNVAGPGITIRKIN